MEAVCFDFLWFSEALVVEMRMVLVVERRRIRKTPCAQSIV